MNCNNFSDTCLILTHLLSNCKIKNELSGDCRLAKLKLINFNDFIQPMLSKGFFFLVLSNNM